MSTYNKLQVVRKGNDFSSVTEVVQSPLVAPEPNQIRIRHHYAGVNAIDTEIAKGNKFTNGILPYDIGMEALGTVDSIGSSVPKGKSTLGQPVLAMDWMRGFGFAEYSYHAPDKVIAVPSLDPKYLVLGINALTAVIGLETSGHIRAGEKVLVTAASGGTGQIAVQWAKSKGCHVIGLTSNSEKEKYLKQIGADSVINYRAKNLDQVLSEQYPDGIDVIWECLGGETFAVLLKHLRVNGRMVIVSSIQDYADPSKRAGPIENISDKLVGTARTLAGFNLAARASFIPEYLPQLISGIEKNTIQARVDLGESSPGGKFVGLEQVHRAQQWLHSSKNIGKAVVQVKND